MEWKLVDSRKETADTKTLRFANKNKVEFKPGQFFLFHDTVNGIQDCRAYSASSSPLKDNIEITVKRISAHFSAHLHELKPNQTVEVEGPFGDFFYDDHMNEIVLIAAGSGIAPLRSIIQYVVGKRLNTKIAVIYSCKTADSVIFGEELRKLAEDGQIKLHVTLTREGGKRIDEQLIAEAKPGPTAEFFVCGPPLMANSALKILHELKVNPAKIHCEKF